MRAALLTGKNVVSRKERGFHQELHSSPPRFLVCERLWGTCPWGKRMCPLMQEVLASALLEEQRKVMFRVRARAQTLMRYHH